METVNSEAQRLNWSTLKLLATSPKLLHWRSIHKREDTPALALGRAIHCAVLEGKETFSLRWLVQGQCSATVKSTGKRCENGGIYRKGAKWYCGVKGHAPDGAKTPAGEVLSKEQLEVVTHVKRSVRAHPVADKMLSGGNSEVEIQWEDPDTGILCRGRVDYLTHTVPDLKTTRHTDLREMVNEATRLLYYGQLAWYFDGAIQAGLITPDAPNPSIVFASTAEPYDVAPLTLSDETLEAGRTLKRSLLMRYSECVITEMWPGICPDGGVFELPHWAFPNAQETQQQVDF